MARLIFFSCSRVIIHKKCVGIQDIIENTTKLYETFYIFAFSPSKIRPLPPVAVNGVTGGDKHDLLRLTTYLLSILWKNFHSFESFDPFSEELLEK